MPKFVCLECKQPLTDHLADCSQNFRRPAPPKYWRLQDLRTDSTIIIRAESSQDAIAQFLECCAENLLTEQLDGYDPAVHGHAWGEDE